MGQPRLPGPDEPVIHVHTEAGQLGPYSRRDLATKLDAGEINDQVHIWYGALAGWETLADHNDLLEGLDAAAVRPRAPGESEDDYLDRVFGELVGESWEYLYDHAFASHIDEVFLGAIITSTLDTGFSLIDISSDGNHHYLRFENLQDHSRIIIRMTHLTGSLAIAKVLGQRASIVVGYGEKLGNVTKIMGALKAEYKSGYISNPEPGTISVDGDIASGYVYCNVDMYWKIDDYVARNYTIDYDKLAGHLKASTHALRKYLRGRFA